MKIDRIELYKNLIQDSNVLGLVLFGSAVKPSLGVKLGDVDLLILVRNMHGILSNEFKTRVTKVSQNLRVNGYLVNHPPVTITESTHSSLNCLLKLTIIKQHLILYGEKKVVGILKSWGDTITTKSLQSAASVLLQETLLGLSMHILGEWDEKNKWLRYSQWYHQFTLGIRTLSFLKNGELPISNNEIEKEFKKIFGYNIYSNILNDSLKNALEDKQIYDSLIIDFFRIASQVLSEIKALEFV